jgi:acylphosphatase
MDPPSERRRLHLVIRGRVQRVGFRWSLAQEAERHGVAGWVRNLPDGGVEAEIEGGPEVVEVVLEWARHGPPGAWVEAVDVTAPAGASGLSRFEIRG